MKTCSICKTEKELDKFNIRIDSKDGYEGHCKKCRNEKRISNPNFKDIVDKANKKFEVKRKGKRWGYHLSKTYGLSEDGYYKMLEEQNHSCAICKLPVDKEVHYGKFVVDHCHSTGKVRELLCHGCNASLGLMKESIQTLTKAIAYLDKHNKYGEIS